MKEKFLKLKEQIMQNKKKAAAVGIAALLLIGAVGYGIVALNADNREVAKQEQTSEKIKDKKTDKTDAADKKDAVATSGDKKETKKKEDKKESVKDDSTKKADAGNSDSSKPEGNTTGSSNTGNSGSSSGSEGKAQEPEQPTHTHNFNIPVYTSKSVYVVDTPAWTETVNEPIYEMQAVWYCNTCGADITANPGGHLDETMHAGYRNDWIQVQTGTNTYIVEHPEIGHYETEQVLTGYQCSCGAVQ